jgi:small ligand-binding sensory domain FIST
MLARRGALRYDGAVAMSSLVKVRAPAVTSEFIVAHAAAPSGRESDWGRVTVDCVAQLGKAAERASLGFVYVTDKFASDLPGIVTVLRQTTGIKEWVGSVGIGIAGGQREYFDEPAVAVMTMALDPDSHCLIPNFSQTIDELGPAQDWARRVQPTLSVVHADPRNARLPELICDLAGATSSYLVGGLASSRGALDQVAGQVVRGGVSGVMFAPGVAVAAGLSQGCSPIGPVRQITAAEQNVIFEIDRERALDVFKHDIGEVLARKLERVAGYIHVALPVAGSDTGDYLVRNLVGIDPERGWLAVGERVAAGDRVMFVRRDRAAAEEDLVRMLGRLKRRSNAPPKAGLYFSCLARGPNLFGPNSEELGVVRQELGDFPLVGMFCNGEISHNRLYGYTGVLALFL